MAWSFRPLLAVLLGVIQLLATTPLVPCQMLAHGGEPRASAPVSNGEGAHHSHHGAPSAASHSTDTSVPVPDVPTHRHDAPCDCVVGCCQLVSEWALPERVAQLLQEGPAPHETLPRPVQYAPPSVAYHLPWAMAPPTPIG